MIQISFLQNELRDRSLTLTFRAFYSSLVMHPNVRVFLSDQNRSMVLARMEFYNTVYVGSVSFVYTEIVKAILLHFFRISVGLLR